MSASDELQARLEAARARRATADDRREKAEQERQLLQQVEREERAADEAEKLAELEEKHGPVGRAIRRVDTDLGMLVVKKPHFLAYRRFVTKKTTTPEDLLGLVEPNLVHPAKAEATRIFEEEPHSLVRAADAVCFLAGVRKEEVDAKS